MHDINMCIHVFTSHHFLIEGWGGGGGGWKMFQPFLEHRSTVFSVHIVKPFLYSIFF